MAPNPLDQRVAPRLPVNFHIRFRLLSSPSGEPPEPSLHNGNNLMANLSRTGFFLSTKNYLEVHSHIEVEVPLADGEAPFLGEAEVVRSNYHNFPSQGRYEYGLKFTLLHSRAQENLLNFLQKAGWA
ncbi:MAG TPA: PilZ domain-containing protein [bacterium]|nr:PilZ domain-containing protein [bacterium]